MNDSQIIAIAVIFVAALGPIMFNNSRITDVGKRIDDSNSSLGKRIDELHDSVNQRIDDKSTLLSQQMKTMEENIMRILGDHETRLQTLENKKP